MRARGLQQHFTRKLPAPYFALNFIFVYGNNHRRNVNVTGLRLLVLVVSTDETTEVTITKTKMAYKLRLLCELSTVSGTTTDVDCNDTGEQSGY